MWNIVEYGRIWVGRLTHVKCQVSRNVGFVTLLEVDQLQ